MRVLVDGLVAPIVHIDDIDRRRRRMQEFFFLSANVRTGLLVMLQPLGSVGTRSASFPSRPVFKIRLMVSNVRGFKVQPLVGSTRSV